MLLSKTHKGTGILNKATHGPILGTLMHSTVWEVVPVGKPV